MGHMDHVDHMQAGRSPIPKQNSLFPKIFYTYVLKGGNPEKGMPIRVRAAQFHKFLLESEQDLYVQSLKMAVIWCPKNENE